MNLWGQVITLRGQIFVSRTDDDHLACSVLRVVRLFVVRCVCCWCAVCWCWCWCVTLNPPPLPPPLPTHTHTHLPVCSFKTPPVCTFKTSPCELAPHPQVLWGNRKDIEQVLFFIRGRCSWRLWWFQTLFSNTRAF